MKTLIISLFFATLVFSQSSNYDSLAYITASVGDHIYSHAGASTSIPAELATYNSENGTNFVITRYRDWWDDETLAASPGNYLWQWDKCFNDSAGYSFKEYFLDSDTFGVIQVKVCYASQAEITTYGVPSDTGTTNISILNFQWYVRRIVTVMESYPNKFFIFWNIPPIVPTDHQAADAARLRWFNKWMVDTLATGIDTSYGSFPQNVFVFDYFEIVDSANFLPLTYADAADDSHPNGACSDVVAPLYVDQVFDAIVAFDALLANNKWLRSSNGRRIFSSDGKAIIMADE